ncbi:ethanolamine ammonia-lyase reactivating factor EutA [Tissierella sp. MSJ-40]|uniref:Ethanolamine ammonia-lyase reactivating factor EutA n=1 Tax=Tissierella simiarum TaxID=2841534 RepID=A0ABS6EAJ5_9FIRM|nr:ethanolamine ammonia-lyase reactivating factor EutA [Tissierella simiarum]MBU5439224.1 ethanolamine ammonia-lyase reactivating factor EutA [Tissierella simiarum]
MSEDILSVGIDVGTSTTQLVFSQLTIDNTASIASIPIVRIVDKKVIYKSDIHFTPLISYKEIDGLGVRKIIEKEYERANIKPEEVGTGAVIITGETARKENAKEILNNLSGLAGDFVVATAGPDLEGIIAGKGAGAAIFSKEKLTTIANLDIGGGTTNIAVFKDGEVIDTACLDIGGRLIKVENNKISYISDKIKKLATSIGLEINIGDTADKNKIKKITDRMAVLLEEVVGIRPPSDDLEYIVTNKDLKRDYKIEYISFTGGVADYIKASEEMDFKYGDIGVILGESIFNSKVVKEKKIYKPIETIRATVVGAGSHTTDISGSTIYYSEDVLPIKNIPILKLTEEDEKSSYERISEIISDKINWFNLENEKQLVGLAMKGVRNSSFDEVQSLAKAITKGMKEMVQSNFPLIVILENDLAKALGQNINIQLNHKKNLVCIDSIKVENGDYIDIGKPIASGTVVPVVVKTLLFGY